MKKYSLLSMFILLVSSFSFSSCVWEKGPRGQVYVEDKSVDEMVTEVLDAEEEDGWVYEHDVDLYTKIDGEWVNAGRHGVYRNLSDDDECNLWVEFGSSIYRMPAHMTDSYGYRFKVQWQGDFYYF